MFVHLSKFLMNSRFRYKIVLDSDDAEFGGHKRLDHSVDFFTFPEAWDDRANHMFVSTLESPTSSHLSKVMVVRA